MKKSTEKAIGHIIDGLEILSKEGTAREKLFCIAVFSAIKSMESDSIEKKCGIEEFIEKIIDMSICNTSIKEGYVDKSDLALNNIGIANVMSMLQDVNEGKDHSENEYHTLFSDDNEDEDEIEQSVDREKIESIINQINDLNERLRNGEISKEEVDEEIAKLQEFIKDKYSKKVKTVFIKGNDISLRNMIVSDMFSVFVEHKKKVDSLIKHNPDDEETKDNYAIMVMIKTLFYAHKLGFTKEMYQIFYNGREMISDITKTGNQIMKESKESMHDFFFVNEKEIIENMENDILNDPEIEKNLKDELDNLFNNDPN